MTGNGDAAKLIEKAIVASIKFEELMDSIDFDSYFKEAEEDKDVKDSYGGKLYYENIGKASNCFKDIVEEIDKKVEDIPFKPDDESSIQWLINELIEAKKTRLEAKQQINWKNEKEKYNYSLYELHTAFDKIPRIYFPSQKEEQLIDNFNWVKVLYFNELAICYSGLDKSSMSLGYAEQSLTLLEDLYPQLKNMKDNTEWEKFNSDVKRKKEPLPPLQIIRLYTFALYNKGEAERLLRNEDEALRTFHRIYEIYKPRKEKKPNEIFSDYNSALLRKEMILINLGRGEEAKQALEKICEDKKAKIFFENFENIFNDNRLMEGILEIASAFTDSKEYDDAYKILERFYNDQFRYTSVQRKANVYMLRLLYEYKKNRPEDFAKNEQTIIEKYPKFANLKDDNLLVGLLKKSVRRQDGGNFKRICTYLAERSQQKYYDSGDSANIENFKNALKYFYLYLFNEYYFDNDEKKPMELEEAFSKEVIPKLKEELDSLLEYADKLGVEFQDILDSVNDAKYLGGFFDLYVDMCLNDKLVLKKEGDMEEDIYVLSKTEKKIVKNIVKKLVERLTDIYSQNDNDIELERIEKNYELFMLEFKRLEEGLGRILRKGEPEKFIEAFFFQNKMGGMSTESIVDQMKKNTDEFVKNVVGTSKIHYRGKGEIKGIFNVLRRWNSFTPTLRSPVNPSKGGGYFLHFSYNDETCGIVIDPGYNFLENFFSQGFKIGDIDVVLVSHAHPDHTDNLPSILSLFYAMNERLREYSYKKNKNKKNLTLVLSPGVFEHYTRIIKPSEEVLKDIIVVHSKGGDLKDSYNFKSKDNKIKIKIEAFGTSHHDLSQFQSLGFRVIVNDEKIIGYTGDAKWDSETWPKHLQECSIICAHLGSIVNVLDKKDFCNTFCYEHDKKCKNKAYQDDCKGSKFSKVNVTRRGKSIEQTQKENHLYLAGLASFFNSFFKKDTKLKLGIISEFGEELKYGIRMDLYYKFNDWLKDIIGENKENPRFLPGDIGLEVDVFTGDILCHCCNRFVKRDWIYPTPYGKEEAICFVCKECRKVLSTYQIGEMLEEYCENGRTLELVDESE